VGQQRARTPFAPRIQSRHGLTPATFNTQLSNIVSNILQELESKISALKTTTVKSNVGIVREIGDGVARIEGLSDVMLNELIEFPGGLYGSR